MKNIKHTEIAAAFKNEMAARYALPELRDAALVRNEKDGQVFFKMEPVETQPTGQLAGIVKKLFVSVEVGFSKDAKYVAGSLHYRYQHHGGGSNGADQEFVIVLDRGFDCKYEGCVNKNVLYRHEQNTSR